MRTPRAASLRMVRFAFGAIAGLVPASAVAATHLQWLQPAESEAVAEFRVYAGTSPDAGELIYAGLPAQQAGVYSTDVVIDALEAGSPVYVWLTAWNPVGESGASNAVVLEPETAPGPEPGPEPAPDPDPAPSCDPLDSDCDGILDRYDNCPFAPNPGQEDAGGLGQRTPPDGIGDACQCGDVSGDGLITSGDASMMAQALKSPPLAVMNRADLCDVAGSLECTGTDSTTVKRALQSPTRSKIRQQCAPAQPPLP